MSPKMTKVAASSQQELDDFVRACFDGNHMDVLAACKRGVSLDERASDGFSALAASLNGHREIVRLLCERGAAVHLQITDGLTALS
jgi:hypothetical protein